MKNSVKKMLIIVGVILAIVLIPVIITKMRGTKDYSSKYAGVDLSVEVEGLGRTGTYTAYMNAHKNAAYPQKDVQIKVTDYAEGEDVEVRSQYMDSKNVLYTGNNSTVTWRFNVPEAGFYNIHLDYIPDDKGRGVAIERTLLINGELPFNDAENLTFSRLWTDMKSDDGKPNKTDNRGNEIRATQVQHFEWQTAYCKDEMGYITEPYCFYFDKGVNEITFISINEPMAIRELTLKSVRKMDTYAEYSAKLAADSNVDHSANTSDVLYKVQGEEAALRSEPSLYGRYDRSSPTTQPYSVTRTILNYIGGDPWNKAGQWIEWDITVPKDGFYNITVKGRQNYARGSVSARTLYIDGEIPFEEVKAISFEYSNDWKVMTLSDEKGDPYRFYLTAGTHKLRLEATLGGIGPILEELEDSTYRLNQIYRRILVYTGANPDTYRDYHIEKVYPEVIEAMDLEAKRLYKIIDDVVRVTGQKAEKIATALTLATQMEKFVRRPDKIAPNFMSFKNNITSLGTAILDMSETKLDIDYIVVTGDGKKVPKDKASAWDKVWHEIKSFIATFTVDYDAVGDVFKGDNVVKVWIVTGRDQGTILKTMVDDTFIPESTALHAVAGDNTDRGVKVNVEIVEAGVLMNAVMAGKGPDVVLSIGADQPVNYALRNAVEDLSQFDDCDEVLSVFNPSGYRAYEYNGGIYALPETQTFNVMYYRKDIMEQLDLPIPNTWDELIALLPTIQGNNLEVGFPSPTNATLPDLAMYYTLLYQAGGEVYDEDGKTTIIDNEEAVNAFAEYTRYYTDYGFATDYDFVSRFRSGEMPLGLANYTIFNTLVVAAPEIRGLWDFALIPGTRRVDENGEEYIDRSVYTTGTCTMMLKIKNETRRNAAWEFMKWWVRTDTQVRFGREMEALLGSSARYATANPEAFEQLAWSEKDVKVLKEEWSYTVGFREVAGGYYTSRHIVNAIRKVINTKQDPRETILDYSIKIDEELRKKRKEFGLAVD